MIREKELVAVCTTTVARYPRYIVDDVDYIGMVRTGAVVFNATDVIALIRSGKPGQLITRSVIKVAIIYRIASFCTRNYFR